MFDATFCEGSKCGGRIVEGVNVVGGLWREEMWWEDCIRSLNFTLLIVLCIKMRICKEISRFINNFEKGGPKNWRDRQSTMSNDHMARWTRSQSNCLVPDCWPSLNFTFGDVLKQRVLNFYSLK